MKKRLLFVDDEPKLLEGLQRMLRPMRHEWEMSFVQTGQEALEHLSREAFDVIVSDMRMPGMDGAQLLGEVMKHYPLMVRIILSGHSDQELALNSVKAAHQFLSKPCDPETLKSIILRACSLRDLLTQESIKQFVSNMTSLPSLPSLYLEMMEELRSSNASLHRVGEIISKDIGMTAKILQLVNSAFFGLPRHVSSPAQAVTLLGLDTVRGLVLSIHIFQQLNPEKILLLNLDKLWQHSLRTGILAKAIAKEENQIQHVIDDSFTAGLLHDMGKPILSMNFPESHQEIQNLTKGRKISTWEAEHEVLGASHSEVGAYLLGLWGLPDLIVEAVAFHHSPSRQEGPGFSPLLAVHAADNLEHQPERSEEESIPPVDMHYLSEIHMTDRFIHWAEICHEIIK